MLVTQQVSLEKQQTIDVSNTTGVCREQLTIEVSNATGFFGEAADNICE
jgi:hypothetical protein